ncbi:MAG: DUF368 domain-containing protein [Gemmatimonadales bacterium]|nr:MAG: DUF368 domain-containing protein [Gemmatimonadales bacterium]
MGVAELVPGISGGTIAFITGIYIELVRSVRRIGLPVGRMLLEGRFREAWHQANLGFLIVLWAGMGSSVLTFAAVVSWLLENRELQVWGFFFGLIAASVLYVGRHAGPWTRARGLLLTLGILVGAGLGFMAAMTFPVNPFTIFLGGAVAICAWILPGVSGSFVLLLLGQYPAVVRGIAEVDLVVLGSLAAGCTVGLLAFARFLIWLLRRAYEGTLALLCGFMAGALVKIWPWKVPVAGPLDPAVADATSGLRPAGPFEYARVLGEEPMIGLVILSTAVGVLIVLTLDWLSRSGRTAGISPGELD